MKGNWEIDHILPVAQGGQHLSANLQVLCKRCNQGKGARTTQQLDRDSEMALHGYTCEESGAPVREEWHTHCLKCYRAMEY